MQEYKQLYEDQPTKTYLHVRSRRLKFINT